MRGSLRVPFHAKPPDPDRKIMKNRQYGTANATVLF
jgi:hypothetical protein